MHLFPFIFTLFMAYQFLEHTADVKFVAEGESLEKVFSDSAMALKETICGDIKVLEQIEKKFEVQGIDLSSLLYNFLEEFLVLLDSEDFLLSNVHEIKINVENKKLVCVVFGDKAENYKFTNDVKAVTYNDMFVEYNDEKQKWKTQVVLDV